MSKRFLLPLFLATFPAVGSAQKKGGGTTPPPDPAIAYVHTRSTAIQVMNSDGSNRRTVYTPSELVLPSMSPDGRHVAFGATVGGQKGIYVVGSDGSGLRLVTPLLYGQPRLVRPAWSPVPTVDGQPKLLFVDYAYVTPIGIGPYDLFAVNLDGSGRRQLTADLEVEAYPEWSRDATRIVLLKSDTLKVAALGLVEGQLVLTSLTEISELAGSPLEQASSLASCTWANTADLVVVAAVTPDSGGNSDLWAIALSNPSLPLRLTSTPRDNEGSASFAPDDRRIYFHTSGGIQAMNPDGSGVALVNKDGRRPNHRRL